MSDQDFFFDEDEQVTEKPSKARDSKKESVSAGPSDVPGAQTVTLTVAALIGVVALLAGMVVGILLPIGGGTPSATPTTVTPGAATGGGGTAPQLTPEQIQGGELPPGHPNIGGGSGSQETTK